MKWLFDFFPIILFFIAYKSIDIYAATAVLIAASVIQTGGFWLKHRRFENLHLITLVLVVVLGSATLLLHDENFIKWKPTVVNGLFAIVFLGSQWVGKQPLIQRMMGSQIQLPAAVWVRLNLSWVVFFILSAIANLYVAFHFSTDTWVNFKLFGLLGMTIIFVILQGIYLSRFISEDALPATATAKPESEQNK